jgi:hypothetical protein
MKMKMIVSPQFILQLWLISMLAFHCSAFLQQQNNNNYNGNSILHKAKPSFLYAPSVSSFLTLNAQSNDENAPSEDDKDSNNNNNDDDDDNSNVPAPIVTKEMFLRDLLRDPDPEVSIQKKRRKGQQKKESYKSYRATLDNRDRLPFAVQVTTPDPYTHPDVKEKLAQSNRVLGRRKDAIEQSSMMMASSVYTKKKSGSDSKNSKNSKNSADQDGADDEDYTTKLGEFALDKHTATGDLLNVGDVQYKVVRLKCQYKYSGGGRFVMVRKILQVKEVGRLETEESLARQFNQQSSSSSSSSSSRDDDVPESSSKE